MAGGTNSQIKDQNKTVKKQHEYDKQVLRLSESIRMI